VVDSVTFRLGLPLVLRDRLTQTAVFVMIVTGTWFLILLNVWVANWLKRRRAGTNPLIPLGSRVMTLVTMVAGALMIAQTLRLPVNAIFAGIGLGGLAIALALQPLLANLFGGMAVTLDRVMRVGDFCRFGDQVGTVEDIGLRSTRIRTTDRTVVVVPNGEFSKMSVENFGLRDKRLFRHTIRLRINATPDQIRTVLRESHQLLIEHPQVESESARIRLENIGRNSLDLGVFAYVPCDWEVFLQIQENLLLQIMEIIEASGTGIAVSPIRDDD